MSKSNTRFIYILVLLIVTLSFYIWKQYSDMPTQTICDRCSHKLIIQAKNGDQVAQQKLVNQMTKEGFGYKW